MIAFMPPATPARAADITNAASLRGLARFGRCSGDGGSGWVGYALRASVLGATILIGLQTYLVGVDFPITLLIGVIFILCVTFFRRGIYNELARMFVRSSVG